MTRKPRMPSAAAVEAQLPAARAAHEALRRTGRIADAAHYDRKTDRIVLELSDGYSLAVPRRVLRELRNATPRDLAAVEVSPGGSAIIFPSLDADYSVPALVMSALGKDDARRELARVAGQSTSPSKARAARENGRKGGRPRKAD